MPMYWDGGWAGWLFMSLVMVLFWGTAIGAIVYLVRGSSDRRDASGPHRPDALAILEERFARGEIDEKEFRDRRNILARDGDAR